MLLYFEKYFDGITIFKCVRTENFFSLCKNSTRIKMKFNYSMRTSRTKIYFIRKIILFSITTMRWCHLLSGLFDFFHSKFRNLYLPHPNARIEILFSRELFIQLTALVCTMYNWFWIQNCALGLRHNSASVENFLFYTSISIETKLKFKSINYKYSILYILIWYDQIPSLNLFVNFIILIIELHI